MPQNNPSAFARDLAARLGSAWTTDDTPVLIATDEAADRLWGGGPLAHTAFGHEPAYRSVLTHPHGLQLYVLGRPHRPHQYLVLPLLPAGTGHVHTRGIQAPPGIAVPHDPVRAASLVRRRMLYVYRLTSMQAQRQARPGPGMPVEFALDASGKAQVSTVHARALRLLLTQEGFRLDPGSGLCHLPDGLTGTEVTERVRRSALQLGQLGFDVSIRPADRPLPPAPGRPAALPPASPSGSGATPRRPHS